MNPGAILIGIAILILAVLYVINPLNNEPKRQLVKVASQEGPAKGGQINTLAAIRDLDFDFQTGKVIQEDYEALRAELVVEAAEYLQEKKREDEKVEELIRARQQKVKPTTVCSKCSGEIRPQDLFCPICGAPAKPQPGSKVPPAQITCPSCGKKSKISDLFCSGCGSRLDSQTAPENTLAEN